jgi:hypothetical protein
MAAAPAGNLTSCCHQQALLRGTQHNAAAINIIMLHTP